MVGLGTVGFPLGFFLRSAAFAVIPGSAYLVAIESIAGRVLPPVNRWLPGQLLLAVGQGGNGNATFPRALLRSGIYLVGVAVLTAYAFTRRDVTA